MKWFINVAIIFFIGLLFFNISQFNYQLSVLSAENSIFTYSGMFAFVGLLLSLVLLFSRKIVLKK